MSSAIKVSGVRNYVTMIHGKKFLDLSLTIICKFKMPHSRGMEVRRKLVETCLPEECRKRRKTWKE